MMQEYLNAQETDLLEIYRNYRREDLIWTLENVLPYIADPEMGRTAESLIEKLEAITQEEYERLLLYCFGLDAADGGPGRYW
ncbi:MAG: hypothetical protein IKF50_00450 [Clostridia bacterium]|nr:hypothetical protein [Clostridia bacterium]